jgi:predicted lipoprotein with Yx(FWY)xxD motif
MHRVQLRLIAGAFPFVVALLAGCGSSSSTPYAKSPATSATTTASTPAKAAAASVKLADNPLGKVLVDSEGRTLYLFTKDTSTASNCTAACASTWPPLITTGAPALGAGLDAALFGTIVRTDGTNQVTFNGHPVYYYAKDAKPGDTTGQKVCSVWYAIDAHGNAIGA